jgi:hypothetical protein
MNPTPQEQALKMAVEVIYNKAKTCPLCNTTPHAVGCRLGYIERVASTPSVPTKRAQVQFYANVIRLLDLVEKKVPDEYLNQVNTNLWNKVYMAAKNVVLDSFQEIP